MIKVNLLKDQTVRARKSFAKPNVSRTGLVYFAIFLVVAGAMTAWYLYLNQQISTQTARQVKLREDEASLQKLKLEVDKYEKLKQKRQSRIDLIEKLKENQSGPVLLLNTVIQAIPQNGNFLLTSLEQKVGNIQLNGLTRSPQAIPDLLKNLASSGIFSSVELEVIERQDDDSKFSITCTSKKNSKAEVGNNGSK
jgi:Tfp pilus assembly protein PilN